MALKKYVPWWAKIGAKVLLSRVPARYRVWQRLNLFVHGQMDRPEYAYDVVQQHLARVGWPDFQGRVVLELGPGDSLATAVIAKALGARRTILVDAGAFASGDVRIYHELADFLRARGHTPPAIEGCTSVDDVLAACDAVYLTRGLEDLRGLPAGEVDLVFSQAVLEHVRRHELQETLSEIFRVTAPGGVTSHQVDLKDHLGGALNSLRFSDRVWEAEWMVRSGFYTNRVRYGEMLAMFERAGWVEVRAEAVRWERLPTARDRMDMRFREMGEEELGVAQFDLVARRV